MKRSKRELESGSSFGFKCVVVFFGSTGSVVPQGFPSHIAFPSVHSRLIIQSRQVRSDGRIASRAGIKR
jgi:hypothetical protein